MRPPHLAPQRLRAAPAGHRRSPATHPCRRASRAITRLAPETIEQIARRVAQLLQQPAPETASQAEHDPAGLLTATQLAKQLGVSRSWVYENARRLGAITLGQGPRARLRFDLQTAKAALQAPSTPTTPPTRPARRQRRPADPAVPLLPVNPSGLRGLLARTRAGRTQ